MAKEELRSGHLRGARITDLHPLRRRRRLVAMPLSIEWAFLWLIARVDVSMFIVRHLRFWNKLVERPLYSLSLWQGTRTLEPLSRRILLFTWRMASQRGSLPQEKEGKICEWYISLSPSVFIGNNLFYCFSTQKKLFRCFCLKILPKSLINHGDRNEVWDPVMG